MKYFILLLCLTFLSCSHNPDPNKCNGTPRNLKSPSLYSHSCPKPGHGKCYLCDDPLGEKSNANVSKYDK